MGQLSVCIWPSCSENTLKLLALHYEAGLEISLLCQLIAVMLQISIYSPTAQARTYSTVISLRAKPSPRFARSHSATNLFTPARA